MRYVDELIVHCSATRPDWMKNSSGLDKVKEIRRWHVEERGWSDIGYHFIIDRDGIVYEGRPVSRIGAHTKGYNKASIGVCLIGGHGGGADDQFEEHFTEAQRVSLIKLRRELLGKHPITKTSGHNKYAPKACPCFRVSKFNFEDKKPVKTFWQKLFRRTK